LDLINSSLTYPDDHNIFLKKIQWDKLAARIQTTIIPMEEHTELKEPMDKELTGLELEDLAKELMVRLWEFQDMPLQEP
jgi:hypothetical protein